MAVKKEQVKKAPVGRPTRYDPKYCSMLVDHMYSGLSYASFAGVIRVHFDTLYEWEKIHPEFSEAKKAGQAGSLLWWERQGQDGLWTHPKEAQFNNAVWIFNMKNRHNWKDRVEQTVETTKPITISYDPAAKVERKDD